MSGVRVPLPPLLLLIVEKSSQKDEQIDIRVAKLQKSAAEMLQLQQFCGKKQFPRIETHKNQAYKAKIRDNFKIKVNHRGMTSCE